MSLDLEQLLASDPARAELTDGLERADHGEISVAEPPGPDRAAVDEDGRNVCPRDGDERARHVLVATAHGDQAVHALRTARRLDRVRDDFAGDEGVFHAL